MKKEREDVCAPTSLLTEMSVGHFRQYIVHCGNRSPTLSRNTYGRVFGRAGPDGEAQAGRGSGREASAGGSVGRRTGRAGSAGQPGRPNFSQKFRRIDLIGSEIVSPSLSLISVICYLLSLIYRAGGFVMIISLPPMSACPPWGRPAVRRPGKPHACRNPGRARPEGGTAEVSPPERRFRRPERRPQWGADSA